MLRALSCNTLDNVGLKLQVIFRKGDSNYRALLRKMTYEDKAFYDSPPPAADCLVSFATEPTNRCESGYESLRVSSSVLPHDSHVCTSALCTVTHSTGTRIHRYVHAFHMYTHA